MNPDTLSKYVSLSNWTSLLLILNLFNEPRHKLPLRDTHSLEFKTLRFTFLSLKIFSCHSFRYNELYLFISIRFIQHHLKCTFSVPLAPPLGESSRAWRGAENLNQLMLVCRGTRNRGHPLRVTLKALILLLGWVLRRWKQLSTGKTLVNTEKLSQCKLKSDQWN